MKNASALVTGATGSIGAAVCIELAKGGMDVALHYNKNSERAERIKGEIESAGRKGFLLKADISNVDEIRRTVRTAADKLGSIDLFVHCASVFMKTPFDEVSEELFDDIVRINLKAAYFFAQEISPVMTDGGRMIFMSDIAAAKPYAGYLPYCISKAGIDALVKGLAKKLASRISVNAIAPYIVTRPKGMSDAGWNDLVSKTPARRESPPHEIAQIVSFLAKASPSLTGQIIAVDGGRLLR